MKALISPNESFRIIWVSSWEQNPETQEWSPVLSQHENCLRIAQIEQDNNIFEVAQPLFWTDCPEDCSPNVYFYKDGVFNLIPQDEPQPQSEGIL